MFVFRSSVLGKRKRPVIVMGADVTHPAPGSKRPSIAAVRTLFLPTTCIIRGTLLYVAVCFMQLVASMDVCATRYRAATRIQKSRQVCSHTTHRYTSSEKYIHNQYTCVRKAHT